MAGAKRAIAGSVFKIGTTATDGSSDTYTQIKGARQVGGDIGGSYQMVDTTDIEDTTKQETKTLLDPGATDLEMHAVVGDAGQAALKTAFEDMDDIAYNFEIVHPAGDKHRFKAKVTSYQIMIGTAASVRTIRSRLSLTEVATYVAAP